MKNNPKTLPFLATLEVAFNESKLDRRTFNRMQFFLQKNSGDGKDPGKVTVAGFTKEFSQADCLAAKGIGQKIVSQVEAVLQSHSISWK